MPDLNALEKAAKDAAARVSPAEKAYNTAVTEAEAARKNYIVKQSPRNTEKKKWEAAVQEARKVDEAGKANIKSKGRAIN